MSVICISARVVARDCGHICIRVRIDYPHQCGILVVAVVEPARLGPVRGDGDCVVISGDLPVAVGGLADAS